ncbi:calcium-activated chloride channel regulator 1-like [Anolis sagrei]|uniref:calcium-activated chloride channel regulator 1-like n=1 Tax=Anolis sagrei TaxID=38937 RepID=UPI0035230CC5
MSDGTEESDNEEAHRSLKRKKGSKKAKDILQAAGQITSIELEAADKGEQTQIQIIEMRSWVGIVTFHSFAVRQTGLRQITSDTVRESLKNYLPDTVDGGTNICSGVREGFQVFLEKYTSTEGCEIVLLTNGEDSGVSSCFAEVRSSGSIIHTIALGPSAAKELEMLTDMTGGLKFSATDSLDDNGLTDAFSRISSGSGDISQQSIQKDIGFGQALFVPPLPRRGAYCRFLPSLPSFDGTVSTELSPSFALLAVQAVLGTDTFHVDCRTIDFDSGTNPGVGKSTSTGSALNSSDKGSQECTEKASVDNV